MRGALSSFLVMASHAGKTGDAIVAHHADVDLSALDELFGNGSGISRALNELHALLQFGVVVYDGSTGDACRTFLGERLDEQGECQTFGTFGGAPLGEDCEFGNLKAVVGEDLLGQCLIAREC